MKIVVPLIVGFVSLLLAVILMPIVDDLIGDERGSTGWNCANDPTYNSSLEENKLTCTVTGITTGLFFLGIVVAIFMGTVYSGRDEQPGQPGYGY